MRIIHGRSHESIDDFIKCTKLILAQKSFDVSAVDKSNRSMLILAIALCAHYKIIKMLLKLKQININRRDISGETALMCAAVRQHALNVRLRVREQKINQFVNLYNRHQSGRFTVLYIYIYICRCLRPWIGTVMYTTITKSTGYWCQLYAEAKKQCGFRSSQKRTVFHTHLVNTRAPVGIIYSASWIFCNHFVSHDFMTGKFATAFFNCWITS
jgi:ankyrin repeat protein